MILDGKLWIGTADHEPVCLPPQMANRHGIWQRFGQQQHKPFLAAGNGKVFVVDPEYPRVLVFTSNGQFNYYWGEDLAGLGFASGVAVDPNGGVWLSDGANNQIMHFTLP